jgi:hypothetical protein
VAAQRETILGVGVDFVTWRSWNVPATCHLLDTK